MHRNVICFQLECRQLGTFYHKRPFLLILQSYFPPHLLDSEHSDKAVTEKAQKAKTILHQVSFSFDLAGEMVVAYMDRVLHLVMFGEYRLVFLVEKLSSNYVLTVFSLAFRATGKLVS